MKIKFKFVWLIAGIILSIVSCKQKETKKEGKITGKLQHAEKIMIYLQRFTDRGEQVLDSTRTDAKGNFEMAAAQLESASKSIPEIGQYREGAKFYKAFAFMQQDRSADALPIFEAEAKQRKELG